ncbi:hypothetical protein X777_14897, partial [Ooceraea biroi]
SPKRKAKTTPSIANQQLSTLSYKGTQDEAKSASLEMKRSRLYHHCSEFTEYQLTRTPLPMPKNFNMPTCQDVS